MSKKILVILLCFNVLFFSIFNDALPAQAFVGVDDATMIAFLATTAIAAGAVGTYVANGDGTYSGTLHDFANTNLLNMSQPMKDQLKIAMGTAYTYGYMKMKDVTGLWDYLHSIYLNASIIPKTIGAIQPNDIFNGGTYMDVRWAGTYYQVVGVDYFGKTLFTLLITKKSGDIVTDVGPLVMTTYGTQQGNYSTFTTAMQNGIQSWCLSRLYNTSVASAYPSNPLRIFTSNKSYLANTGLYPGTQSIPISLNPTITLNDGTLDRPIAIPQNPGSLNNWDGTTAIPTTGAVPLTAVPSDTMVGEVATTVSPTSTADWETTITGGITGALNPTGSIDWTPLKLSADLFTTRFPFSLPWDLKNTLTAFGSGSAAAPSFHIKFMTIDTQVSMAQFDSLASGVRVLELFCFGIGLVLGTRKLLGGAT